MQSAHSHFAQVNGIKLHYLDYAGDNQPLLLMHGLTANAHAFGGLVASGITDHYRLISPDLRGRGLSDYPAFCYTIEDHANDIIGLLDHLGIEKVLLGGHSFGGLLGFYMAATYPERVEKLIVLDAAAQMNPKAPEMLSYSLSRLDRIFPSWHEYLNDTKKAPYNTFWDEAMLSYYQADVKHLDDGSVTPRSILAQILEVAINVGKTDWVNYVEQVPHKTLLLNAPEEYTMGEPLLPDFKAKETVAMMPDAQYKEVDGNHQTMLYGSGARKIVHAIQAFTMA
jgi:pimeloyl-ACP methyl ester carboxylesterase